MKRSVRFLAVLLALLALLMMTQSAMTGACVGEGGTAVGHFYCPE